MMSPLKMYCFPVPVLLGSLRAADTTCWYVLPSSEELIFLFAVETTHANFLSRFLIKLPICRNVEVGRWLQSPFTRPGIASDPWRTDVNVAHANVKTLCGYVLQGDGGITLEWRSQQSQIVIFCVCYQWVARQYHAAGPLHRLHSRNGSARCSGLSRLFFTLSVFISI